MNRNFLSGLFIVLFSILFQPVKADARPFKGSLEGLIKDAKTGAPLSGVSIYFPDLKIGTSSQPDGSYKIDNLPQSVVLVQISYVGYKQITDKVDLSTTSRKDFMLEPSFAELNEVVVTGMTLSATRNRNPAPISTVSAKQLAQLTSSNIIDAIASQPGISQITTGAGISKPVIRGLGFNRVLVVSDGIRQEGQQWGDEHGVEIDEFGINRVEILKGPASLAYGSDALAGVINMLPAPTLQEGKIKMNLLGNYQTNNGQVAGSANFAGNLKGFIWDVRYSGKIAQAYQNKYDGYVFNSGLRENTFSGIVGLNRSWGYVHLHLSAYHLQPGIVEGERDSATGAFVKPAIVNGEEGSLIATKDDFKSYSPLTPYQQIHHYKLVLNNNFILKHGTLKTILGLQQNRRQEYADILKEGKYGLYFLLNTLNYDVRYNLPEKNNMDVSVGINGMYQQSQNRGTEFLIPDYSLFDFGIFAIAKKSWKKLDISGGLRYDTRNEKAGNLWLDGDGNAVPGATTGAIHRFSAFNSRYQGISGSLGASYQFNELMFTKLNVSRGFRAPNIAEISANGIHEGSVNYVIGVPSLKPENSLQIDYALGLNSEHVTAEADLFYNMINNFIYLKKLQSVNGSDSLIAGYNTFKYDAGDAHLWGAEISVDIHPHPLDWLHFENSFSWVNSVQTNQPDSAKYLPFTPAPKFSSDLRADKKQLGKWIQHAFVKIGITSFFDQNHYYAAYGTETATRGYTLLNAGIGADIVSNKKSLFSILINGNNLTDVAYQSHLSRLKYFDSNNVTGRPGVFNMGRNISFKLIVPLDLNR